MWWRCGGGGVVAAVSESAFKIIYDGTLKHIQNLKTLPLIMSDIFQKDFAAAMTQSGMLQLACQCAFSGMTPATRKAHIDAWHSKQVAELENFYLTSRLWFDAFVYSCVIVTHLSGTIFSISISSHT
jgi:hypothetical protein